MTFGHEDKFVLLTVDGEGIGALRIEGQLSVRTDAWISQLGVRSRDSGRSIVICGVVFPSGLSRCDQKIKPVVFEDHRGFPTAGIGDFIIRCGETQVIIRQFDEVEDSSGSGEGLGHVAVIDEVGRAVVVLEEREVSDDPVRVDGPGIALEGIWAIQSTTNGYSCVARADSGSMIAGITDVMKPHHILLAGAVVDNLGPLEAHGAIKWVRRIGRTSQDDAFVGPVIEVIRAIHDNADHGLLPAVGTAGYGQRPERHSVPMVFSVGKENAAVVRVDQVPARITPRHVLCDRTVGEPG